MNFDDKLKSTCETNFSERDIAYEKNITRAFEEMNARGLLHSGMTVEKVAEVARSEIVESCNSILLSAKEIKRVYFQKTGSEEFKKSTILLLKQRIQTIQDKKEARLKKVLESLLNKKMLEATSLKETIARAENDANLELDKFIQELDLEKGKTLKDRTLYYFNNHPVAVFISIVISAVLIALAFYKEIKSLLE